MGGKLSLFRGEANTFLSDDDAVQIPPVSDFDHLAGMDVLADKNAVEMAMVG